MKRALLWMALVALGVALLLLATVYLMGDPVTPEPTRTRTARTATAQA